MLRGSRMIFIRADSNIEIASGHIMRCIAIAKYFKKIGENVCFLIADENPISILKASGMNYVLLNSDWHDLMTDSEFVIQILKAEINPILLIDTYKISKEYVEKLRPYCKIAYIGSKHEYLGPLDVLINYSADIDYQFYEKNYNMHTKLLLGLSFAPLREEFQNVTYRHIEKIQRILITTGNTDPSNMVEKIIEFLIPIIDKSDIILEIVVGRMFSNKIKLEELRRKYEKIHLNENVRDLSVIMKQCDLAISANGTTVYELLAMGIPTISFAMVSEQVRSAKAFNRLGTIAYCGNSSINQDLVCKHISGKVKYYLGNYFELNRLVEKSKKLIDGKGCEKIVKELLK